MKRFVIFFTTILLFVILSTTAVQADNGIPYRTFSEDSRRQLIPTQDAYVPVAVIHTFKDTTLNQPEDITIFEDRIYIADTGNSRILVVDEDMASVQSIGEGILNQPTGVFVHKEDDNTFIYVADYGNKQVYKFAETGDVIKSFDRPQNSPLFTEKDSFQPNKIAVDRRGNLYIVDLANLNGMIQLSQHGDFLGYYGQPLVKPTLKMILQFIFYSKEQRQKIYKAPSTAIANLAVDHDGLITTITNDASGNGIERLDISGQNLLPEWINTFFPIYRNVDQTVSLIDLAIGPIGNIYVIDSLGFISEYDFEGNLLFVFGGKDASGQIKGLLNNPSGIAVDRYFNIYALDKVNNNIHVYSPTTFANYVHEALFYYQDGKYEDSYGPWLNVLEMNNMFDLAHKGLGKAYYKEMRFEEALEHFRIANDKAGYSDSFWELRNEWLNKYLAYIFFVLLIFIIDRLFFKAWLYRQLVGFINKPLQYLKRFSVFKEMSYLTAYLKNPADMCYEIKRNHRVSVFTATILYVVLFVEYIISKVYTGFVFNDTVIEDLSIAREFSVFILPLMLFIIANYLVGSINDGEGKFRDVYIGTVYSFTPLILFWPLLTLLSNALTLNEAFIFQSGTTILWGLSFVYLFIMIKEMHNFTFQEAIKITLITLFTMVMLVAAGFIFYVLFKQIFSFISEVFVEVRSNA